jgi:intein/homing endonuclease
MTPIADKEHLQAWIQHFLGFTLPDCTVTQWANSNPLDFVWQVYRAIMDGKPFHVMSLSGRDSGKCCRKGTLIMTDRGLAKIEDIKVGDRVWDGNKYQTVINTFDEGYLDGVTVKTASGRSLTGSLKHRVQVLEGGEVIWKHIKDLSDGDNVIVSLPQGELEINKYDYDLGYFCGLMTGDGGLSLMDNHNTIMFSNIDPEVLKRWELLACRYLPVDTKIGFDKKCTYRITNKKACDAIRKLGFKSCKSTEKRAPEAIYENPSRMLGFIAGFYDTDGGFQNGHMLFYQSNPKLLQDCQSILASLGVYSYIRKTTVTKEFLEKYQQPYSLIVNGLGMQRLLDIGLETFVSVGPRTKIRNIVREKPTQAHPIPSKDLKPWIDQISGLRSPKAGPSEGVRLSYVKMSHVNKYESISREKIINQRNAINGLKYSATSWKGPNCHKPDWVKKALSIKTPDWIENLERYAVDRVVSITYERAYFYDLEVTDSHAYWSNGFISHNTLSLSVIDLLAMLHDQRSALHSAMTKPQALRAREYLQAFILKHPILRSALTKENQSVIQLNVSNENVGLEIISLTPKAVQGAHYPLVSVDELTSSMDPQQIKAYRDLSGVPGTHKLNGKPAVIVKITSRQNGSSLAEQEIKNAHKSGIQIVNWTTIDCMKKCPPERSGTTPAPMNINIIKGLAYTDEQFSQLKPSEQDGFERTTETMSGCLKCPLLQYCQGRARHQTSESPILREIDDVISKVNASNSHEWVLSQLLSLQPSSEGLVYPEFNHSIHIPSWNRLWETLTKEEPRFEVDRTAFIKELKKRGTTIIAGVDWGYTHPATCVVCAIDDQENVYVIEALGMVRKDDPEWVEIIKDMIQTKYDIQMYLPDSENPSGISLLRKADLPVAEIDKGKGSVKAGINVVKGLLKVPGTNNRSRLFICPDIRSSNSDIPGLIEEFSIYSKEIDAAGNVLDDKVKKEADHYMDALRYAMYWYFHRANAKVFWQNAQEGALNSANPAMTEIARAQGVYFNDNRDSNDDDDGNGGGGSGPTFYWT